MSKRALSFVFLAFLVVTVWPVSIHADIKAGLAGYWPLDGDAIDGSTSGNNGTVFGNVRPVPDRLGMPNATLFFPGEADSYVDLGDPTELQITGAMTLTAWVVVNGSNQNSGRIISKHGGSGSESWDLGVEADSGGVANSVTFQVASGPSDSVSIASAQPLPTDRWVHIAGVYRPGQAIEIYVDGQLRASSTTGIPGSQFSDNGLPILIGSGHGCLDCGWHGLIDEVRMYDRAVTLIDIWQIMRGNVGCSSAPQPRDGATNVPRDVTLRWAAGPFANRHDVYLGKVFVAVNNASRTSPGGVLAMQGLIPTAYAPNSDLEFGRTYYWRVDEVNAAPDSTVYKGNVWSFTVEPLAPPIENVVATTNLTSIDGAGPDNSINGSGLNADDEHSIAETDMWLGAPNGNDPVWLQYEFDAVYKDREHRGRRENECTVRRRAGRGRDADHYTLSCRRETPRKDRG